MKAFGNLPKIIAMLPKLKEPVGMVLIVLVMVPLLVFDVLSLVLKYGIWEASASAIMRVLVALPLPGVKVLVIGIFITLAAWALSMPRQYAFLGAPDQARWRDVRIWAAIVIGLEIIPYLFF